MNRGPFANQAGAGDVCTAGLDSRRVIEKVGTAIISPHFQEENAALFIELNFFVRLSVSLRKKKKAITG